MPKHTIDSELVRSLALLLDETQLSEIEYDQDGLRIRVARHATALHVSSPAAAPVAVAAAPAVATAPAAPVQADPATHPGALKSPMVGIVYCAPEPGATRFFNVGDTVSAGQTLLLIEAMKTFNPVPAPRSGKIVRQLIEDGQPVEFGEPLLIIE